jgi:hypothetical protein
MKKNPFEIVEVPLHNPIILAKSSIVLSNLSKKEGHALPFPPGRPEESHLQSPTVPYVSLSTHTARASLSPGTSQPQADIER